MLKCIRISASNCACVYYAFILARIVIMQKKVYLVIMILILTIQGPVLKNNEKKIPPSKKSAHGILQTLDLEILCCCCCCVTSVVSNSVQPQRWEPTRLCRPWDSPGKNTGVGCHFLLQCMKVKRESEVAQSCLILRDPMDGSPPGSSVYGICQARVLEWGAIEVL